MVGLKWILTVSAAFFLGRGIGVTADVRVGAATDALEFPLL